MCTVYTKGCKTFLPLQVWRKADLSLHIIFTIINKTMITTERSVIVNKRTLNNFIQQTNMKTVFTFLEVVTTTILSIDSYPTHQQTYCNINKMYRKPTLTRNGHCITRSSVAPKQVWDCADFDIYDNTTALIDLL